MTFKFPKINAESVQERFKDGFVGKTKETKDSRLYVLTKDKDGSGSSLIRFLPAKIVDGKEGLPYSVIYRHTLQLGKGSFVSCICPTTVNHRCPICEWNKQMNNEWVKEHNTYRKRKYLSNILIMEEANEELVGKVRLFEYGAQIMNILESKIYPKQIGSRKKEPLIYYDWEEGANFELILSNQKGSYPSWDNSNFVEPSSIMEFLEEKDIDPESIVEALYDTEDVVQNLKIESYDDIKRKLNEWCLSNGLTTLSDNPENSSPAQNNSNRKKMNEVEEETDSENLEENEDVEETKEEPKEETSTMKFSKFKDKYMNRNKE